MIPPNIFEQKRSLSPLLNQSIELPSKQFSSRFPHRHLTEERGQSANSQNFCTLFPFFEYLSRPFSVIFFPITKHTQYLSRHTKIPKGRKRKNYHCSWYTPSALSFSWDITYAYLLNISNDSNHGRYICLLWDPSHSTNTHQLPTQQHHDSPLSSLSSIFIPSIHALYDG